MYSIRRTDFQPARVKAKYVCGRTGIGMHRVDTASERNWVRFWFRDNGASRIEFRIKLACRWPGVINDAILLNEIDFNPPGRKKYESLRPMVLCKHCFPESENPS